MDEGLKQIILSLEIIYSPQSNNDQRHKAQFFLDGLKKLPESPFYGYQLANPDNNKFNYIVRHFGLNLLLNSITSNYANWDLEKRITVRNWVVELATKTDVADPNYLKEKIAFIWSELAKRCWGSCLTSNALAKFTDEMKLESWADMDNNLLEMWNHNTVTRNLTLIILRCLFEDVYLLDDPIVAQRTSLMNQLEHLPQIQKVGY
ncbi:unnamed protein product [Ambrosiozyma monospora]|uniref:Unnamed protein product n=1 Tax=Ambrosiozyma monospora TaxID=43982 RepID=A0A9W6Z7S1_AMBMO|nr:unnamed protein product [Ambrosiozyma monospora]